MAVVTVVGGANIDHQGIPDEPLRLNDSNPGSISTSAGGVGRNIAESIARLGPAVQFLTVVGDDDWGRFLLNGLRRLKVNTSHSLITRTCPTSTYLCLLEEDGTLHVAVSDMKALEELRPLELAERSEAIRSADLCVVDTNLREESLLAVIDLCDRIPVILDTVSVAKAVRARRCIGRFYAVKPNESELEVLTGIKIKGLDDLDRAVGVLHELGTREVFVSRGERGLYYSDGTRRGIVELPPGRPVNVSGAGDVVTGALAVSLLAGRPIEETAAYAACAGALAARSGQTVGSQLSDERIRALAPTAKIRPR